jgi:tight adherence protein B
MTWYLAVGFSAALAVATFLYGVHRTMKPIEEVDQRMEDWLAERLTQDAATEVAAASPWLGQVERRISHRAFAESIRTDLARADLSITVSEYLFMRLFAVLGGFAIGYLIQRDLLSGLILGVVGFYAPVFYIRRRKSRRLRMFNQQLPDVLDHLVGSLRAGYGLLQAVEWIGKQLPDPAGAEFDRVVREVRLGRSLREALDSLLRRNDSDDLAMIITAINVQHEVGGNLANILEIVAHTIRERVRIVGEIQVLTAQQRYSGYVLMAMPIILGLVIYIINPEYEKQLFAPGATLCLPIGAVIMMVLGFLIMRKIIEIEI